MPPRKIAILGGGMGGLAAAWRLMQEPNASARYEITVYQRDWLLGGKGASGRNAAIGQRIEEHGLHILMGFYDNALEVLKSCYDDLAAHPTPGYPVLPWKQALTPSSDIFLGELVSGNWGVWKIPFPPNALKPGVDRGKLSIHDQFVMALGWMWRFFDELESALKNTAKFAFGTWMALRSLARTTVSLIAGLGPLESGLQKLVQEVWDAAKPFVAVNTEIRRLFIAFHFAATNINGMLKEGLLIPGADQAKARARMDAMDYRAWFDLRQPVKVPQELGSHSPLVNAIYELVFARDHTFAAGTCLYDTLQMLLSYKGSLFYRMNAGMGDIVFAPLYLYLKSRGVTFRFFHNVTALHVDAAHTVTSIDFDQLQPGVPDYDPLINVKNLACWPNAPKVGPSAVPLTQLTLRRSADDFHDVVLAISVAALPAICGELSAANPAFADMLQRAGTVQTRSVQVWLDQTASQLGWPDGPAMMGGYAPPFNAWADMSQTLDKEVWTEPRSVAYFCDTILQALPPLAARQLVRADAEAWIMKYARRLFPNFDWARLVDGSNAKGPARLDAQYIRANVDPSDHYVLTPKDSTRFRMGAADSGFTNLYLAGDWTHTPLNAGCLEAATMGGRAAGEAIARLP